MAHKKQTRGTSRKSKRRDRRQCLDRAPPTPPRGDSDDYTIPEWCRKRRVSRGLFYKMLKHGTAPKTIKMNKCRRISRQADAEWQAQREAVTAQTEVAV